MIHNIIFFVYADNFTKDVYYQSIDIEGNEIDDKDISKSEMLEILNSLLYHIDNIIIRTPNTIEETTCNNLDVEVVYWLTKKNILVI